eukprot:946109-Rhodomonas_salina.4
MRLFALLLPDASQSRTLHSARLYPYRASRSERIAAYASRGRTEGGWHRKDDRRLLSRRKIWGLRYQQDDRRVRLPPPLLLLPRAQRLLRRRL